MPRRTHGGAAASPDALSRRVSARFVLPIGGGIATTLALTIAAQTYLSMRSHGHSFVRILAWQIACWIFWAAVAPMVLRTGSHLASGGTDRVRRYGQAILMGLALIVAHALVSAQFTVWLQPFVPVQTQDFGDALRDQLRLIVIDVLIYGVMLLAGGALAVYDRARRLELRESRLEAQLARANLDMLRLEIQPHFLFNTLNTIGALIRRRSSDRALDMLIGLSDLLRDTLERHRGHLSALEVEIASVQKYVDLYRVRFSDRLDVAYEIDPAAAGRVVPTFILQPLVENAFSHGLSRQSGRCHVEIGARLEPGGLRLWVADDGEGVASDFVVARDAGTGLSNVLSRVESLFGPAARVDVRARETGGTIAAILLPLTAPLGFAAS